MQKILIIQTAYIGDVILATSLVRKVKELAPNSQIDFLLRSGNESLLSNSPLVRKIFIWNKKKKYRSLFEIIKKVRKEKYDAVINIQRFFNSGLFTILSGAKVKIGFDKNPLSLLFHHRIEHKIPHQIDGQNFLHEVQRNSLLLEPIFMNYKMEAIDKLGLELSFSELDKKIVFNIKQGHDQYLVIAPSSVWFTKQYPKNKWIEFLALIPKNLSVFYIGAPADKAFIDEIKPASTSHINAAGMLTLLQSALLMKEAQRVFVNDSAPLHLASAVDAKTTAIFCSTVTDFGYYPLSTDSIVIEENLNLECRPCGLHGKKECPLSHFKCAQSIETNRLLESINHPEC